MAIRENLAEWSRIPFESQAHMIAAMRDPQYRDPSNSAFREAVEAKVHISSNTGTTSTVYSVEEREDSGSLESDSSIKARMREEEASAQQAFLEQYGPLSLSPAQREKLKPVERELPGRDDGYGFQSREQ
ncbi:MAG: hypothetical protein WD802_04465 [Gemmatimonadaceae bacterium]